MHARILLLLSLCFTSCVHLFGQEVVSGFVLERKTEEPLIGATILVKGTQTGTVTDTTGHFELTVPAGRDSLEVWFIGFQKKVVILSEEWDEQVFLEPVCILDFFDAQEITVSAIGGIYSLPVGAQINISTPAFLRRATIKTDLRYQAAIDGHRFLQAELQIAHFRYNCCSIWDAKFGYQLYDVKDQFNRAFYGEVAWSSLNPGLFGQNITLMAGWGILNTPFDDEEFDSYKTGPQIGFSIYIERPFGLSITGKTTFYSGVEAYYAQLAKSHRRFDYWVDYRQLEEFRVWSIGVGYTFTYYLRKQRRK